MFLATARNMNKGHFRIILFNANAEEKTKYLISSFFTSTLNATFLLYHKTMI